MPHTFLHRTAVCPAFRCHRSFMLHIVACKKQAFSHDFATSSMFQIMITIPSFVVVFCECHRPFAGTHSCLGYVSEWFGGFPERPKMSTPYNDNHAKDVRNDDHGCLIHYVFFVNVTGRLRAHPHVLVHPVWSNV